MKLRVKSSYQQLILVYKHGYIVEEKAYTVTLIKFS